MCPRRCGINGACPCPEDDVERKESVDERPMGRSGVMSGSARCGVVPRIAPSFRVDRMRRARCAASRLLEVKGGWQRMISVMSLAGIIRG